jgi:hypothetical protein
LRLFLPFVELKIVFSQGEPIQLKEPVRYRTLDGGFLIDRSYSVSSNYFAKVQPSSVEELARKLPK